MVRPVPLVLDELDAAAAAIVTPEVVPVEAVDTPAYVVVLMCQWADTATSRLYNLRSNSSSLRILARFAGRQRFIIPFTHLAATAEDAATPSDADAESVVEDEAEAALEDRQELLVPA